MAEHPLLVFPSPVSAERKKQKGHPLSNPLHGPDLWRQGERLPPEFAALRAQFENRAAEIRQDLAGVEPEQVIVIETRGRFEDFARAVKNIKGLEWLGEIETDDMKPDDDFYNVAHPEQDLTGRFFLIMSNQQALEQMLSLWEQFGKNHDMEFSRGLAKFRDVFVYIKTMHCWGVSDRLSETGVLDDWREKLREQGTDRVRFEVELWFRKDESKRNESENRIRALVKERQGQILYRSVIEPIAYHGLLAELPACEIEAIVGNPATKLVKCDEVMFFRPTGQFSVGAHLVEGQEAAGVDDNAPLPEGEPIIALIDGLPLANHNLLKGRLVIDDPDDLEAQYALSDMIHGTVMASLILQGDLGARSAKRQSRKIYVRPIMKPVPSLEPPHPEEIPDNILAVDLVYRAVRRMFDSDSAGGPAAPHVKVVNLSICDRYRQFSQSMSPLARLLDWLSCEYGILFIVSAGNHDDQLDLGMPLSDYQAHEPAERERMAIVSLYGGLRNRRILSPAESINALTVGALHGDEYHGPVPGIRIDPFVNALPSPISSFGGGYRKAIKPDMLFNGGRQLYSPVIQPTFSSTIKPTHFWAPPGSEAAAPSRNPGDLSRTCHTCGTSNAAALATRAAGFCYDLLEELANNEEHGTLDLDTFAAPLLKAMLVHSCNQGDMEESIQNALRSPQSNQQQLKRLVARWTGYGMADMDRVLHCTDQRATLLGFGLLQNDGAHVYHMPLPASLASHSDWRRLTVTLAWLSPIFATSQKYRTASLSFDVDSRDRFVPIRRDADDWNAVKRGTVQHEVFEGEVAYPFKDNATIAITVNCREDADRIRKPIAYGLAVTLEVKEGVEINIYNEIRTRIRPTVKVQQSA